VRSRRSRNPLCYVNQGQKQALVSLVPFPCVAVVSDIHGCSVSLAGTIIAISCTILAGLFLIQRYGTAKIGTAFSPIMLIFFVFNSGVGVYNIAAHDPTIFKVTPLLSLFSPARLTKQHDLTSCCSPNSNRHTCHLDVYLAGDLATPLVQVLPAQWGRWLACAVGCAPRRHWHRGAVCRHWALFAALDPARLLPRRGERHHTVQPRTLLHCTQIT